jgi:hypothetical protein
MPWMARLSGALGALAALAAAASGGLGCAMGGTTETSGGGGPVVGDAAGASTAVSSSGGIGLPSTCTHTTDGFSFHLTEVQGQKYGCDGVTGKLSLKAQVTAVNSKTAVSLVACPEEAGCNGTVLALTVNSEDLAIPLVPGAFVSIEALVEKTEAACSQSLAITNLPALGAVANPVTTEPILWLAGADGTLTTPASSVLAVAVAPGCGADGDPGIVDDKLSFTFAGAGSEPTTVDLPMGMPHTIQAAGGGGWVLLDLRSFHRASAPLGDARDFAYWVSYAPPGT